VKGTASNLRFAAMATHSAETKMEIKKAIKNSNIGNFSYLCIINSKTIGYDTGK